MPIRRSQEVHLKHIDRYLIFFLSSLLFYGLPVISYGQQNTAPSSTTGSRTTPADVDSASISGVVLDISGATVAQAQVTLTDNTGASRRTLSSGPSGEFSFSGLTAGTYIVLVKAPGLEPFTSQEIALTAQQAFELPKILLPVAAEKSEVTVRTTEAIAAAEIKVEEQQRVLGIVPNFYTSFVANAAPLTTKQKFALSFRGTFDPVRFLGSGFAAGIQQSQNSFAGYGQGAAGYGKRFASDYGNGLSSDILSHAVFPALFHQDPRYFYQGTGSIKSRFLHAISYAVLARSDSGQTMPNYANIFGDLGSAALSNLYYPHADRGAALVFTNAAIGLGGRAAGSLIREFFLKRVTTHAPSAQNP